MSVSVTAFERWPTCVLCCELTDRARLPDPTRTACCIAMGNRNLGLLRVMYGHGAARLSESAIPSYRCRDCCDGEDARCVPANETARAVACGNDASSVEARGWCG